jgi:hypothetical protein
MSETAKIGSSEWFTNVADRLIGAGIDSLLHKTTTDKTGGGSGTTPGLSQDTSMLSGKLPWILGGVAVLGIGLILWKR